MPVYLHECEACGHQFELEYSIKLDPPKECPECKQEAVKRLIAGDFMTKMELTHKEFAASIQDQTRKMMKSIGNSENKFANIVGETAYNNYSKKPGQY